MKNSQTNRSVVFLFVVATTLVACGVFLVLHKEDGISRPVEFSLVNQFEDVVTEKTLKGNWSLVSFGFTHCVDICPAQLASMSRVYDNLKSNGVDVTPYFITVDPKNDTSTQLKEYLRHFDAAIIGLTGERENIKEAITEFNAYSSNFVGSNRAEETKHDSSTHAHDRGDHSMNMEAKEETESEIVHSTSFYLVDQELKIQSYFNPSENPTETASKISDIIQGSRT